MLRKGLKRISAPICSLIPHRLSTSAASVPLTAPEINFRSLGFIQDPYPTLKLLREQEPMYYSKDLDGWVVTRYEDVRTLLADTDRLTADRIRPFLNHLEKKTQIPAEAEMFRRLRETFQSWVVFNDPPDHTRLRKLMDKAFRKRVIENLRSKIDDTCAELVEETLRQNPDGKMEIVSGFANKLPARVIADLLGVPADDMPKLVEWSNGIAAFVLVSRNDKEKYLNANNALLHLRDYFSKHIESRRKMLVLDQEVENVIDGMLKATEGSDKMTVDELISTAILLIFAGHETTTHLIANGMLILSKHAAQVRELRQDSSLIPNAIEEILRFDGPSLANIRLAAKDFEYLGKPVKARSRMFLFSCSANRDFEVFPDADSFDIKRSNAKRNLTFGFGKHFCIGAPLARLEGELALKHLLSRLDRWEVDETAPGLVRDVLDQPQPPWVDLIVTRGMRQLPLRFKKL